MKRSLFLISILSSLLAGCGLELSNLKSENNQNYAVFLASENQVFVATASTTLSYCELQTTEETCQAANAKPAQLLNTKNGRQFFNISNLALRQKSILAFLDANQTLVRRIKVSLDGTGGQGQPPLGQQPLTTVASGEYKGGGVMGNRELAFQASNGLRSNFRIHAPADSSPQKAYGVLIYLHGDGGGDYTWFWQQFQAIAHKNGFIAVSVLTPAATRQWYADGANHARFLHDLIQTKLYREYNIDKQRVYFTGASGGPQFLTGTFIPLYGNHYRGGAIPMCGGGGFETSYGQWMRQFKPTAEFIENFRIYYYTGTADFLYTQVRSSERFYKSIGVKVDGYYPPNVAHCAFGLDKGLEHGLKALSAGI